MLVLLLLLSTVLLLLEILFCSVSVVPHARATLAARLRTRAIHVHVHTMQYISTLYVCRIHAHTHSRGASTAVLLYPVPYVPQTIYVYNALILYIHENNINRVACLCTLYIQIGCGRIYEHKHAAGHTAAAGNATVVPKPGQATASKLYSRTGYVTNVGLLKTSVLH